MNDTTRRRAAIAAIASALAAALLVPLAAPAAAHAPAASVPPARAGLVDPGAGAEAASAATAVPVYRHGSRAKPLVALTFDDGYSPTATLKILQILEDEGVVGTFFPYGWAVSRNPAVWRKVAQAGHPIANHTQSHRVLTRLTERQVIKELTDARRTVERVTGKAMVLLMRPPGGAWNASTARAVKAAGFRGIVLWDVDPQDWRGLSTSTIAARAKAGKNGSIVLLHAGPAATPGALRSIIRSYRARGFRFVTVSQILGLEPLAAAPMSWAAGRR